MTELEADQAFEKKYNFRMAERCCLNCKHGAPEYDGAATCDHPERAYKDDDGKMRMGCYNCSAHNVCNAWEMKGTT